MEEAAAKLQTNGRTRQPQTLHRGCHSHGPPVREPLDDEFANAGPPVRGPPPPKLPKAGPSGGGPGRPRSGNSGKEMPLLRAHRNKWFDPCAGFGGGGGGGGGGRPSNGDGGKAAEPWQKYIAQSLYTFTRRRPNPGRYIAQSLYTFTRRRQLW